MDESSDFNLLTPMVVLNDHYVYDKFEAEQGQLLIRCINDLFCRPEGIEKQYRQKCKR